MKSRGIGLLLCTQLGSLHMITYWFIGEKLNPLIGVFCLLTNRILILTMKSRNKLKKLISLCIKRDNLIQTVNHHATHEMGQLLNNALLLYATGFKRKN